MCKVKTMGNRKIEVATTATAALRMLWRDGFFRKPKTQPQVVTHLGSRDHNFGGPELGMALKRARYLTRRGAKGSYQYVQKYPFIGDEPQAKNSRKK